MFRMNRKLLQMDREGKKLHVALVGTGKMGRGLIAQMSRIPGMRPSVVVNRTIEKAKSAFLAAGVPLQYLVLTNSLKKAKEAVDAGCIVLTEDYTIPLHMDSIRGVVDATGNPVFGARLAVDSIDAGKDFITLNVRRILLSVPHCLKGHKKRALSTRVLQGMSRGPLWNFPNLPWVSVSIYWS